MVRTLFKKEFKDSYKIFFPILILLISFTTITYIDLIQRSKMNDTYFTSSSVISNAIFQLMFVFAVSIVIAGIIGTVRYMYVNIYNDKGYELFTLPVSSLQIFISKLFIVILWLAILLIAFVMLSIFFQSILGEPVMLSSINKRFENLFINDGKILFLLGYMNQFLYILGAIVTVLFAGSVAHSKYIQKARGAVTFCIVMLVAIFVMYFDMTYYHYISNTMTAPLFGEYYSEFFMTFNYLPSVSFLNGLLVFRTLSIILMVFGTKYMWEKKLQF